MPALLARNIRTDRLKTSIKLEQALWGGLDEICEREGWSRHEAVAVAQAAFRDRPRTSAVRSYLFTYFRLATTASGHQLAGHGAL